MSMLEINKYVSKEENNEAGMDRNGIWTCKKLMFKTAQDLKIKINEVNAVLNKFNEETKKKQKTEKKEKI